VTFEFVSTFGTIGRREANTEISRSSKEKEK